MKSAAFASLLRAPSIWISIGALAFLSHCGMRQGAAALNGESAASDSASSDVTEIQEDEPGQMNMIGGTGVNVPQVVLTGCTSTLVGPSTIISAAHCQGPGPAFRSFKYKNVTYNALMIPHPQFHDYNGDGSSAFDVVVGILDKPVPDLASMKVSAGATGGRHTFYGYGCNSTDGRSGYGVLRRGSTSFVGYYYTQSNAVTQFSHGNAGCGGDSGGPILGSNNQIEGLLSRASARYSGFIVAANIATSSVRSFLGNQAAAHGARVCGVTAGGLGCAAAKMCVYESVASGADFLVKPKVKGCDGPINIHNLPVCKYSFDAVTKKYKQKAGGCWTPADPNKL